ncbi:unnamed protein product [Aureobasidium pullulans]|nr:unnamed protein product [Aureobasidium pullulans]
MLGDDEDLPSDFEGLGDDKEEEDTKKEEADNKKKKKAQAPADIRIDGRLCQVAGCRRRGYVDVGLFIPLYCLSQKA